MHIGVDILFALWPGILVVHVRQQAVHLLSTNDLEKPAGPEQKNHIFYGWLHLFGKVLAIGKKWFSVVLLGLLVVVLLCIESYISNHNGVSSPFCLSVYL